MEITSFAARRKPAVGAHATCCSPVARAMWSRLADRWAEFDTDPTPENVERLFNGMGALAAVLAWPAEVSR